MPSPSTIALEDEINDVVKDINNSLLGNAFQIQKLQGDVELLTRRLREAGADREVLAAVARSALKFMRAYGQFTRSSYPSDALTEEIASAQCELENLLSTNFDLYQSL